MLRFIDRDIRHCATLGCMWLENLMLGVNILGLRISQLLRTSSMALYYLFQTQPEKNQLSFAVKQGSITLSSKQCDHNTRTST